MSRICAKIGVCKSSKGQGYRSLSWAGDVGAEARGRFGVLYSGEGQVESEMMPCFFFQFFDVGPGGGQGGEGDVCCQTSAADDCRCISSVK